MSIQSNPNRLFSWSAVLVAASSFALAGSCRSNANEVTPESPETQLTPTPEPSEAISKEPAAGEMDDSEDNADSEDMSFDPAVLTLMLVDIDSELAVMCSLEASKVYFRYDSANLVPEAKDRLDELATCAKSGPAKDRGLQIIGRTDPAGSDEYNKTLGMSRADSVAKYLADQGVAKTRVDTESKGEQAANEDLPATWPWDRRVTIRLQD